MLKNIPAILSPDLLKILMEMGHDDELVIGDGNFPAATMAQRLVRLDGHGVPEILEAVLQLFPLDTFEPNAFLMERVAKDKAMEIPEWDVYSKIAKAGDAGFVGFSFIERYASYKRAKKAYAIVATSESSLYANKGVVV